MHCVLYIHVPYYAGKGKSNTNGRGEAGGARKMASNPETVELCDALSVLLWDEFQVFATHLGKGVDLPTLKRIEYDHRTTCIIYSYTALHSSVAGLRL